MMRSVFFAALVLVLCITADQHAYGPRGGGGGARPNIGSVPRPNISSVPRPNIGAAHPGTPPQINRPSPNIQRPNLSGAGGGGFAPGGNRPSTLPANIGAGNRPNLPNNIGSGNRPNLPNNIGSGNLKLPNNPGGGNLKLPNNIGSGNAKLPNLPNNIGNVNRPSTLPGNLNNGNRPNLPNNINNINRPNVDLSNRPNLNNLNQTNLNNINRPNLNNINNDRVNIGSGGNRNQIDVNNLQNRFNQTNITNRLNNQRISDNTLINNPTINVNNNRTTNVAVNRPNLSVGNRTINTGNQFNSLGWNQYNRLNVGTVNRSFWNQPANWNRTWYGGRTAATWGRPWYWNHSSWHNGYWNYWATPPAIWLGGVSTGWLSSPGDTFVFSNPYYIAPQSTTIIVPPALDYSAPLPPPTVQQAAYAVPPDPSQDQLDQFANDPNAAQVAAPPAPESNDPKVDDSNQWFDKARAAFKQGDYASAQQLVEKAINDLPSDATLHEFRALTLFAQKKYQDAAAAIYAVLAAGPGWDWTTVSSLYGDPGQFTVHLRDLESFVKQNPTAGYARFLLAYEYLVIGGKDAAIGQLREVVKLTPDDKLSAALLNALTQPNNNAPPAPGS